MKAINIKFYIETLEDFHIGTGLGSIGLYDDEQLKDKNGNPAIRSETLKGLIKQSCREIKKVFPKYKEAFKEIFEYKNLGSLDLKIDFDTQSSDNPFIIHTFTAIDLKKGTGKEGSLRDIEFASKGCKFNCELYFELKNEKKENDVKKLLELGLKNLKWLGGYRRRGFGAIKCVIKNEINKEEKIAPDFINSNKIKLFLQLQDDVCIAGAGQTGNLIRTMDYISGTTALGMLRNPLLKMGNNINDILDDGNVSITNFYPIANKWNDNLINKFVIPVPASLRKIKSVNQYADFYRNKRNSNNGLEIPHWILETIPKNSSNKKAFENIVSQDTLIEDAKKDLNGASDKSISGEYLIFDDNNLDYNNAIFFKPNINVLMRNRIIEDIQSTDENSLFSQEMIEKDTIFVGEIIFPTKEKAKEFQKLYVDWLSGKYNLHVGRGAKPIKVIAIKEGKDLKDPIFDLDNKNFTITLLSDIILYDDNLMPETVLHPKYLKLENKITLENYIASNRIHQSYSGLAGLRRFSDRVIKKGSAFVYKCKDGIKISDIQNELITFQQNGIGYKKEEGFGRIIINLSVHNYKKDKEKTIKYDYKITKSLIPEYIRKALKHSNKLYNKADNIKNSLKYHISEKTFINKIIAMMETGYEPTKISEEISHGKNTSSKEKWNEFEKLFNYHELNELKYEIIKLIHLKLLAGGKNGK